MEKKDLIKDSVKKLLSLDVSDKEIVENLLEVGVTEEDAIELIKEVREGTKEEVVQTVEPTKTFENTAKELGTKEIKPSEIDLGIEIKETENKVKPQELAEKIMQDVTSAVTPKPITEPKPKIEPKPTPSISNVSQSDIEDLWKRGIVVAINSKLAEMKNLKDEIDQIIDAKVNSSVNKQSKQFKVLLESQRDLLISSNKEALNEKQKEITLIIDSKIQELKKYNSDIKENLEVFQKSKIDQEKAKQELTVSLEDVRRTKVQLITEMNSELIKSKSQAQEFIDKSEIHLKEMDERINKTLELEKNIAEGMLKEAEQKIEKLTIARASDLIEEMQVELNKLKTTSKEVSLEVIEQKIRTLDEFKKQFLTSMDDNLTKLNDAIKNLNEKNEQYQKELDQKTTIIDAKIEELTKFEKEFSSKLRNSLEK